MAQNMSFVGNKIQHFRNEKKITFSTDGNRYRTTETHRRKRRSARFIDTTENSPGFGIAFRHITRRPRQLGAGCIKYQLCRSEFLDQFGADTCTHVLPLVGSEQSQPAHGAVYHRNISY